MLVEIKLIVPLSTACERGFSIIMEKIKSACRYGLSVEALDCLMRIRIEGPTTAEPGLHLWATGAKMKRPTFND